MYLNFYGLREHAFELTPDPKFLCLTAGHREALANLKYGLSTAKAVTVLTGEAGTGKTTLIRTALASDACAKVRCMHLTNPQLTRSEFVETLARGFSMSPAAAVSKATLLAELERTLLERRRCGEIMALVVDEAQRMSDELLEEVRLLANIETATAKLLPLVLAGQPELADRLNENSLRQLKQRVALRCDLSPLSLPETAAYIAFRIRTAGGEASRLFTREAVELIHASSRGIPRVVSVICDNALLSGFALGRKPVGSEIVTEVIRDFDISAAASEPEEKPVAASAQPGMLLVPVAPEAAAPAANVAAPPAETSRGDMFRTVAARRRFSLFG
jgi:type II secretory pathway predicted ATPase ExeA